MTFQVIGRTVVGASHVRANRENQDAIDWFPKEGSGTAVAVAVADGHGSASSFRSSIGSRLAVQLALAQAGSLLTLTRTRSEGAGQSLSEIRELLTDSAARRIVHEWRAAVTRDIDERPIAAEELDMLERRSGAGARAAVQSDAHLAYGTTLLCAVVTGSFMAFWQIGDGDIAIVTESGEVNRPLPRDEALIANETTSLCLPNAAQYFRAAVVGTSAPFVLLSTDGLANSFQDDAGYCSFVSGLHGALGAEGAVQVASALPAWLTELSTRGSGDDISLGVVWSGAPPQLSPPPPGASGGLPLNSGTPPIESTGSGE